MTHGSVGWWSTTGCRRSRSSLNQRPLQTLLHRDSVRFDILLTLFLILQGIQNRTFNGCVFLGGGDTRGGGGRRSIAGSIVALDGVVAIKTASGSWRWYIWGRCNNGIHRSWCTHEALMTGHAAMTVHTISGGRGQVDCCWIHTHGECWWCTVMARQPMWVITRTRHTHHTAS